MSKGKSKSNGDPVNHPGHYTYGPIEVIEIIEGFNLPFHLGNVAKYILRAGHKEDELQDLRKAAWYLNRYIRLRESQNVSGATTAKHETA